MKRKEKTNVINQAEIKVGFTCNNNCLFCLNADKKGFSDLSSDEIKEKIKQAKSLGVKEIALTGGEPTIRDDFLDICKCVFDNRLNLEVQTNGRMFSYKRFADMFRGLPVRFLVSVHGDEKTHNLLTNTKSFQQTISGIRNIKKNKLFIISNTVINKKNYKLIPKINSFLYDLNVDRIQFVWMEGMGNALKNRHALAVSYSKAKPYIKKILDSRKFKKTYFVRFPPCVLEDLSVDRSRLNLMSVSKKADFEMGQLFFTKEISDTKWTKIKACNRCTKNPLCRGVYLFYLETFGADEFKPIEERPDPKSRSARRSRV
ncbi:MAG: radical SAM protein [Pseudomonadota bacterium]